MTAPSAHSVVVFPSPDELADAVCARLITALVDVQSSGQVPSWVLTGGTIAGRVHAAVAASPARNSVDWSRVSVWWGDERFLPLGHAERNETQARAALLERLPLDPDLVHPMPASDQGDDDPDAAAAEYLGTLTAAADVGGEGPMFDVLMLGVGPDGHVASLFPEHPALHDDRAIVAVRGAPKPPPVRLTLTMNTLRRSQEVWFVVSGDDKAHAVSLALGGAEQLHTPAAGPRGLRSTVWLLDEAAASQLPASIPRSTSS